VSELYASLLMVGVTLSLGSLVTGIALGAFGTAASSATFADSLQQQDAGKEVAFVDASVGTPASCPSYQGVQEGQTLTFALFNYGSAAFTPDEVLLNGTVYYSSSFQPLAAGAMGTYQVALVPPGACAHPTGQSILLTDASGVEFQFAS
jgi:hypothetical protein